MKRRGFTLVEIITIIAVLSIIALIATPIVLNQIEDAKQETFKASVRNVFDAVSSYLAHNDTVDDIPESGIFIPGSEIYKSLNLKNESFTDGLIYRDKDRTIMVSCITDGTYYASGSKNELEVSKGSCDPLDKTVPIIELYVSRVTSNSITVLVDSFDRESGIVSYEYYLDGKLKATTKDNIYKFENLKKDTEYDIKVITTNGNNQKAEDKIIAKTSDVNITWRETPEGWARSKTVTINYPSTEGNEVYKYKRASIDKEWVLVSENKVDILVEDNVTITAIVERNGNQILSSTQMIAVDRKPPEISIEGNSDEWTTSKQIVVNATDEESGLAEEPYSFDEGKTWQKSNLSKVYTSITENVIIQVKDNVGNVVQKLIDIKYIDPTIPKPHEITAVYGNGKDTYKSGDWTNQNVILKANPDPESTESGYVYQWYKKIADGFEVIEGNRRQELNITEQGIGTYKVVIKTVAGSKEVTSSNTYTVKIDKTNPTCKYNGKNTKWTNKDITINVSCEDDLSGCSSSTPVKSYSITQSQIYLSGYSYKIKDNAGNSNTCDSTISTYVDKDKPTINTHVVTSSTPYSALLIFTLSDNPAGYSGINDDSAKCYFGLKKNNKINYNIEGSVTKTNIDTRCESNDLEPNTTYNYKFIIKDKAGNEQTTLGTVKTQEVTGKDPIINPTPSGWSKSKLATVTYYQGNAASPKYFVKSSVSGTTTWALKKCATTGNTPVASECTTGVTGGSTISANTWYMLTGTKSQTQIKVTSDATITAISTDGTNVYGSSTLKINLDTTPPTEKAPLVSNITTNSVTITNQQTDSQSGLDTSTLQYGYSLSADSGYTWQSKNNVTGLKNNTTYYVKTKVKDKVGNGYSISTSTKFTTSQIKAPTWSYNNTDWATSKTLTATYYGDNITSPVYYVKSSVSGTTSWQLYECTTASGNNPKASECETLVEGDSAISANTWYKLKGSSTKTQIKIKKNGTLYALTSDGNNYAAQSTVKITKIDTSTPTVTITAVRTDNNNVNVPSGGWVKIGTVDKNIGVIMTANTSTSASGYKSYEWQRYNEDTKKWEKMGTKSTYKTTYEQKNKKYRVYVTNNAGTKSAASNTFVVNIDNCQNTTSSNGAYSTCTATCGGGTKTRTVTKKGISGRTCSTSKQTVECNTAACKCSWYMSIDKNYFKNGSATHPTAWRLVFEGKTTPEDCTLKNVDRKSTNCYKIYNNGNVSEISCNNWINFTRDDAFYIGNNKWEDTFTTPINNFASDYIMLKYVKYTATFKNSTTSSVRYCFVQDGVLDAIYCEQLINGEKKINDMGAYWFYKYGT